MKNIILLTLLLIAISLLCMSYAKAGCVGANYTFVCGDRVNQSCVMNSSEIASTECFIVVTDNVAINCDGYSIKGNNSGVGIDIRNTTNVTIKNCMINGFLGGVSLRDNRNATVFNSSINRNLEYGIKVDSSNYTNITNNTINDNGAEGVTLINDRFSIISNNIVFNNGAPGIKLTSSTNDTIRDNIIYKNVFGVSTTSASYSIISNNTAYDNTDNGFLISSSSNNTLTDNTAYDNSKEGFSLRSLSANNNLTNNTAYNNSQRGFYIDSSSNNTLTNNRAYNSRNFDGFYLSLGSDNNSLINNIANNNAGHGLRIESSSNNLTNNTAYNNFLSGFFLRSNFNNILVNNTAYDNTDNGFFIFSSSNNTLTDNRAYYNNHEGFYISGNADYNNLTGNIAHHNNYSGFVIFFGGQYTYLINNHAYNNSLSNEPSAGFGILGSNNTILLNNTANSNLIGIAIVNTENVNMTNNTMNGNSYNFVLWGDTDEQHNHSIDTSNRADGKSIFYLKNGNNMSISIIDPATFYCIWCDGYKIDSLNISREFSGVYFWNTNNSRVNNVEGTYTYNLIRLAGSSNNTFTNIKMGANYDYDFESSIGFSNWTFVSGLGALNNTFNDFNFNGVVVDFVASEVVMRKADNIAPPSGYKLINKNLEADDLYSTAPYLFINISYNDSDILGIEESSLFITRYNGTFELNPSVFSNPYGVNTAANYVYANITNFGSGFGIIGRIIVKPGAGGGGGGSYTPPICEDGVCDRRESYLTCPKDCQAPSEPLGNISYDCGDLNVRGCRRHVIAHDIIKFLVKNQEHKLQINKITNNSIELWIWSSPAHYTINVGETKQFDLDKNGYNDFALTLNSITGSKADLVLKALTEAIPSENKTKIAEQPPTKPKPCCMWLPYALLIVLAAIIIIVIIAKQREKRLKHLGYK